MKKGFQMNSLYQPEAGTLAWCIVNLELDIQ